MEFRYIPTGPATIVSDSGQHRPIPTYSSEPDFANMSLEDIAAKMRPRALAMGTEYTLDEQSSLAFAKVIQEAARQEALGASISHEPVGSRHVSNELTLPSSPSSSLTAIFGSDDRVQVLNPSASTPWVSIARVGTSSGPSCTAFKMTKSSPNLNTAMSSAHCFHNGSGFYDLTQNRIRFGDSSTNPSPYGELYVQDASTACFVVAVPSAWDGEDAAYDFAVISLNGGALGANCNTNSYPSWSFGYQGTSACVTNINGVVAGYPGGITKGVSPIEMWYHQNNSGYTSCPTFPTQIWYENDTTSGQSGSPYWTISGGNEFVRGIHWGFDAGFWDDTNGARRITSSLIAAVDAWGGG